MWDHCDIGREYNLCSAWPLIAAVILVIVITVLAKLELGRDAVDSRIGFEALLAY